MTNKENPAGVRALAVLTRKIISGEYGPEQPLKETVIAVEENLSRNAVREALNQLVGCGVVDYRPFCGYRIHKFTDRERIEWYEFREAIEPVAVRRLATFRPVGALERLSAILKEQEKAVKHNDDLLMNSTDREFHTVLVEECGNRCFARMQNRAYLAALFNVRNTWLRGMYNRENNQETYNGHCEILRLIKEGRSSDAEALTRLHTGINRDRLIQIILLGESGFSEDEEKSISNNMKGKPME